LIMKLNKNYIKRYMSRIFFGSNKNFVAMKYTLTGMAHAILSR
jgi:hypothetical protein